MADNDQQQQQDAQRRQAQQDEQRRRDEAEKARQQTSKQESKDYGTAVSNEPDPRSPEEQQKAIDEHNQVAKDMADEALEEKLEAYDPEKLGYRGNGGMDLVDTRNSSSALFTYPAVAPVNPQAREIAEENLRFNPAVRQERQMFSAHPNDATARAEVIARR